MAFSDPYRWYAPFEMVEEMERYLIDQEEENERRLHWAIHETARHRALIDAAFRDALQKYAPVTVGPLAATSIMDGAIHSLMVRK